MKTFWKQFWRNMAVGVGFSLVWFYGFFSWTESFWAATIGTNLIGFFIGRYWIFKEGTGKSGLRKGGINNAKNN